MEKDLVLATHEAVSFLKISKPVFLQYIRLGKIRAIKAGNGWTGPQSELYRFLKGEKIDQSGLNTQFQDRGGEPHKD